MGYSCFDTSSSAQNRVLDSAIQGDEDLKGYVVIVPKNDCALLLGQLVHIIKVQPQPDSININPPLTDNKQAANGGSGISVTCVY